MSGVERVTMKPSRLWVDRALRVDDSLIYTRESRILV